MNANTPTSDLAQLGIRTATRNVLRRNGINTIAQLRKSIQVLPLLPGVGVGVINEAVGCLLLHDERKAP
jgi:predicted RecB family nuclease